MTETPKPDATFPTLTIVDLEPVRLESLDEITRAQLEKANRLYGGSELRAEKILAPLDEDDGEAERIDPSYLERGRVLDGGGHHLYDVYLYMVDSGTIFLRGSTDVIAEVIQFGVQSDDPALENALEQALRTMRSSKAGSRKGGNRAMDAYGAAAAEVLAVADAKAAKKSSGKTAGKTTAPRKPAGKRTAPRKPAASKTTAKKAAA